jgi:hypothetical protein
MAFDLTRFEKLYVGDLPTKAAQTVHSAIGRNLLARYAWASLVVWIEVTLRRNVSSSGSFVRIPRWVVHAGRVAYSNALHSATDTAAYLPGSGCQLSLAAILERSTPSRQSSRMGEEIESS